MWGTPYCIGLSDVCRPRRPWGGLYSKAASEPTLPSSLTLSTIDILGGWLFVGGCFGGCRMFGNTPGLHPWDATSTLSPTVTTKLVSRYCQMSPFCSQKLFPFENHCSRPYPSSLGHVDGLFFFKNLSKATVTIQTTKHLPGDTNCFQTKAIPAPGNCRAPWGTFGVPGAASLFSWQKGSARKDGRALREWGQAQESQRQDLTMLSGWLMIPVCWDFPRGSTGSPVFRETPKLRTSLDGRSPGCFCLTLLLKMALAAWWPIWVWDTDVSQFPAREEGAWATFLLGFRRQQTSQACCCCNCFSLLGSQGVAKRWD